MTATVIAQDSSPLTRPVTTLFGVGPERTAQLAELEIRIVEELLLHRPRRYEDRRHFRSIAQLSLDEPALTRGKVATLGVKWFQHHTKSIFELILEDGTGRLHCRWWNLPFMEKYFKMGDEVVVFGKPLLLKPRTIDHPETEVVEPGEENSIHLNRLTPIYPLTEGLPQRWLRALIWRTLATFEDQIPEPRPGLLDSGDLSAPNAAKAEALVARSPLGGGMEPSFPSRARAIRLLHFPDTLEDTEIARRRLALDEFVEFQVQMLARRKNFESKAQALPCAGDNHLIKPFLAHLGYKLTEAQTRVLRELRRDMAGPHPMRRLLQGDVGSGKTVVAACCALMTLESGYNAALMAPTEILADQHYRNFTNWFLPLGLEVELQTGSRKTMVLSNPKSKVPNPKPESPPAAEHGPGALAAEVHGDGPANAHSARPTLFIGTHALIEAGFAPDNLGMVIIDEQHKFGVAQRERLVRKGHYPHLLVMTATPIPRTLALTVYGELDHSAIDQLPPGRGRLKTYVRTEEKLPQVWKFIRVKLAEGRQAYVVYPRIEETRPGGVKAVVQEFETVRKTVAPFQVGLLHGRLKAQEKEAVMGAFRGNTVQVLVATSLVEVGVDVPNATVMLIENAEQFGLAQLHQLRGRIGRAAQDGYCILMTGAKSPEAEQRLNVLAKDRDGFRIAEEDLKLRGPGELLGHQQSGLPKFRFGDLQSDWDLLRLARQMAAQIH
jgi:ATP-dependent DNA helicase RecG